MQLLLVYCVVALVGEVMAFGVGLIIERLLPSISLLMYMALFFGVLWGGWLLAVHITDRWSARRAS